MNSLFKQALKNKPAVFYQKKPGGKGLNCQFYIICDRQVGVGSEGSYIGELAHSIGLDSNVVLLELLFDLIDARGDVFGLRTDKGVGKREQTKADTRSD